MKNFLPLALVVLAFGLTVLGQANRVVPEPQYIVVDSKDNVFVTIKYGMLKIAPDGTVTDLSKQGGPRDGMDRQWRNLIVDSRDNLYASENGGTAIYKITVSADNKASVSLFAGQQYGYQLEDGPLLKAGFNVIGTMAIDRNDNIYVTSNYEKIKDAIGSNFVTDPFYAIDRNGPSPKYDKRSVPRFSVVRKVSGGMVSTLRTPDGKYVLPHDLYSMTADLDGNIVYAAAGFARFIGKIEVATGAITSIAGQPYKRLWCPVYTQGEAAKAEFVDPANAVVVDRSGSILFTDQRINRIIRISGGKVSTLAGGNIIDPCSQNIAGRSQEGNRDGKAISALFHMPHGLAYDSKGNLYIADNLNHAIRNCRRTARSQHSQNDVN